MGVYGHSVPCDDPVERQSPLLTLREDHRPVGERDVMA
jgi:hypothetical protein